MRCECCDVSPAVVVVEVPRTRGLVDVYRLCRGCDLGRRGGVVEESPAPDHPACPACGEEIRHQREQSSLCAPCWDAARHASTRRADGGLRVPRGRGALAIRHIQPAEVEGKGWYAALMLVRERMGLFAEDGGA